MYIKNYDKDKKIIDVAIPLTNGTGKTRIKQRDILNQYGLPVATRTIPFNQKCYVEWQIGYDVIKKDADKARLTTLTDKTFIGANGAEKYLYELSEYIKLFYSWGVIDKQEIFDIKNESTAVKQTKFGLLIKNIQTKFIGTLNKQKKERC